jgi:hypothetical protein
MYTKENSLNQLLKQSKTEMFMVQNHEWHFAGYLMLRSESFHLNQSTKESSDPCYDRPSKKQKKKENRSVLPCHKDKGKIPRRELPKKIHLKLLIIESINLGSSITNQPTIMIITPPYYQLA